MKMPSASRLLRLFGFALLAFAAFCWSGCASKPAPAPSTSGYSKDAAAIGASPSPIKIKRQ